MSHKNSPDLSTMIRGDVFYADLSPVVGSEQRGIRPVLIIQNDIGNRHSPTTIIAAISAKPSKGSLPTHVPVPGATEGLAQDSVILTEQVRTIDKSRITNKVCHLSDDVMAQVDQALMISLALGNE